MQTKKWHRSLTSFMAVAILLTLSGVNPQARLASASPTAITFTRHQVADNLKGAESVCGVDMDRDGDMDMLTATYSKNDVTWWENDGDESFAQHSIFNYQYNGVVSVFPGDLDSDGDVDVVSASGWYYDEVLWFENDGNENFTPHTLIDNLDDARAVHAVDLDGDTDIDILCGAGVADLMLWWENIGSGTFLQHTLDSTFNSPYFVSSADLDLDGDVDVLGTGADGIAWWENGGLATFTRHSITDDFGRAAYAADMDGDRDLDVLSHTSWWENDGSEHFTSHPIDSTYSARHAYPADMDGDGHTDILTASQDQYDISWWRNDGNENFTRHSVGYLREARHVKAADLNGDGDKDILAIGCDGDLVWWESDASAFWSDFELQSLSWDPATPEEMEDTELRFTVHNLGPDFDAAVDDIYLDLKVKDADTGDQWYWRFPGTIDPVLTDDTETFTVERFWFTRSEIDTIEACVEFGGGEQYGANNCTTQNITVAAANPWRECLGVPLDAVMFFLDAHFAGAAGTAEEAGSIFLTQAPRVFAACNNAPFWDADCLRAWIDLSFEVGFAAVKRFLPHEIIITLVKNGLQLLWSSAECAANLTKHYIRAAIEEAKHRDVDINAVAALSPVNVHAMDSSGRRAGFLDDGTPVSEIPGSEILESNGHQLVLYPGTETASVAIAGTAEGAFDLIVSVSRGDANEIHTLIYADVPVTANTEGEVDVGGADYSLRLDDDDDGVVDRTVLPTEEIRTEFHDVFLPLVVRGR